VSAQLTFRRVENYAVLHTEVLAQIKACRELSHHLTADLFFRLHIGVLFRLEI